MARRRLNGGEDDAAAFVYGVRPVGELLASRPHQIERIFVARDARGPVGRILREARHAGIPVSHVTRERLALRLGRRTESQGIAAVVAPRAYADSEEICRRAAAAAAGLLVLVDRMTDPGNLGSLLRTCAAAGVDGVLLSREGTVGLTAHVLKASAGAAERVPVGRETRPPNRVAELRKRGFEVLALDPRGEVAWDELDLRGPTMIVAGGEARGPRPAVADACSRKVAIPLAAGVESLNVAVAVAVLLFEALRQRRVACGDS
ncbi:MAG TPA: RNA methyltransferase [Candidatus Polarisedimenticolaceae bacterium]|nr:RNA methyltransferase [Candidatus Polarisedimenticolaceae bacterium]